MTKKGKRTALLQRTEQVAELQRENEQLRARLAAPEKTDEKLRQSEERYRLLADNASDVIWIADVDLNMTYVSPSAARMLGCGMNELMTPAVSQLLLPESVRLRIKDFGDQVASESRHPGRSARELTLETRLQLRDGSTIWVEQRIDFIRDELDRLTGIMGITRDVTDRRLAEEELRASEARNRLLIENANEGILVVQDEVVKFANPKLSEISGYSMQGLVSKPLLELFHQDDRQTIQGYYFRRIKGEQFPHVYPIRLLDKAGKTKWVEINAVMLNWEGNPAVMALVTDLTERRKAEEALRDKQDLLNRAQQIAHLGSWELDVVNNRLTWSDEVYRIFGLQPQEFAATYEAFLEAVHSDDRAAVDSAYSNSLAEGSPGYEIEHRIVRRPDGEIRFVQERCEHIRDESGRAVRSIGMVHDITERKKAEESLRESEERFRQITENMLDAVSLVDKDGIIRYVSPSHEGILGYKAEDLVGTSVFDPIFPEDRDSVMAALDEILKKREGRFQYRFRHSDGHYVWGEASARIMVDDDGNMSGAVIASRDITDRKKAEEALKDSEAVYKRLFENTQTAMEVVSGETGLVVLANETTARMFGFDSADDLVGVDSMEYLLPEERDRVATQMAQALVNKDRGGATELSVRTKDGRWLWINALVTYTEHRGKTSLLISLIDLTSRKQAEEKLKASEEKYRLLTEQANDVIWTTDMDLRTTYMSPSVERILGFKPEERVGVEAAKAITPESLAHVQGLLAEQLELERQHTADARRTVTVEMEYYRKDGSTVWLENQVSSLRDEHGTLMGFHAVARDVSERRRAERAVRDSEAKYRDLFEHTLLGMEVVDGETGKVVLANRSLARMFGFKSPTDMVGTNPLDYVLPEDLDWVANQITQLIADPTWAETAQIRARTEDGRIIWLTGMGTPIEYEGRPAMLLSLIDITAAKEAELKLRESEEKNRAIINNAAEAIVVLQDGMVKFVNPRGAELVGWTGEELTPMPFLDYIHPEDRQMMMENYLNRLAGEEVPNNYTFRMVDKQGSTRWIQINAVRLDWEGKPAVLSMLNDITDRMRAQEQLKESEERYRLLAQNASDIIWVIDSDLKITYVSPSVTTLLGYSAEELVTRAFDKLLTPSSLATITRLYEDGLAEEESAPGSMTTTTVEIQVARKDGSALWLEAAVSTIRDSAGRFAGFQGACRDITGRKRAEDELQKAHAELEARVERRTSELKEANTLLVQEIRQRRQAQGKLQESEAKYRELVESANSIILELDTKGKVTFFNRFAQEFFGFSESDILGRAAVGTIAPPVDSEGKDLKAQTRDLIKHPENYLVIENEGVRRSGERVWISWTNKGIYDAKGKLRNVLCIGMDRTEQRRVAEMLEQQLTERVATEERQRLARDLHDAVTQTLFSASLIAEVLPRLWKRDRAEGERRLEELRRLTRGALAEMRMLLLELRPGALGEVGLANLLGQLVEATAAQAKLQVDLDLRGECDAPAEVQVALYRVAQEALNNVVKHSGAEEAKIRLACEEGSADLTVSDNGSGFDSKAVSPESLGLRIMQERAEEVGATVKVDGRVGRGTRVRARWAGAKRRGDS